MTEYIEREALYQTLEQRYKYSSGAAHKAYGIAVDDVLDAPAANVAPVVYGRWEFDGSGFVCSECEEYALYNREGVQIKSKSCPNCGAKMDLEDVQ